MSWYRQEATYFDHPKTYALCERLQDTEADRYMPRVWAWASAMCEMGRIPKAMAPARIEGAAKWVGPRGKLFEALVACGFVDVEGSEVVIHDWDLVNGSHIRKERYDRERKRRDNLLNPQSGPGVSVGKSDGTSVGTSARTDGRTDDSNELSTPPLPPSRGGKRSGRINGHANGSHYAIGVPSVDRAVLSSAACSECGTWHDVRSQWGGTSFISPICSKCRRAWAVDNVSNLSPEERTWWQLETRADA